MNIKEILTRSGIILWLCFIGFILLYQLSHIGR